MTQKAHKNHSETFEGLLFKEQSQSITAQINNLKSSVKANVRKAKKEGKYDPNTVLRKRCDQIERMLQSLVDSLK